MTPPITLLTVPEAAARLRIGRSALWRHIRNNLVKKTRVGGRTFIRETELNRLIERGTR
jgi:excisionase family DNA binding protein